MSFNLLCIWTLSLQSETPSLSVKYQTEWRLSINPPTFWFWLVMMQKKKSCLTLVWTLKDEKKWEETPELWTLTCWTFAWIPGYNSLQAGATDLINTRILKSHKPASSRLIIFWQIYGCRFRISKWDWCFCDILHTGKNKYISLTTGSK